MDIWHSSFGAEKTSWLSDPVSAVCHKLQLKIYTLYPVLQRLMDFFFYNFTQFSCIIKSIFDVKSQYFITRSL